MDDKITYKDSVKIQLVEYMYYAIHDNINKYTQKTF